MRKTCEPIPLIMHETELGCLVPVSHKLQKNGYFRRWVRRNGTSVRDYGHRIAFMEYHGLTSIREGWEVDHVCRNRACCNPRHMRLLTRPEHQYLTSRMRGDELKEEARLIWETNGRNMTGEALGNAVGVAQGTASRWIREWREENEADRMRWAT